MERFIMWAKFSWWSPAVYGGLIGLGCSMVGFHLYTWQFWVIILVTAFAFCHWRYSDGY
jgi:hypothetical protein